MSQEGGVSASARAVEPRASSKRRRGASAPEGSSERAPKNRRAESGKTESASGFAADGAAGWARVPSGKRGVESRVRIPLSVTPRDDDGAAGGGAAASPTPVAASVEDDEAFARRLQEEENQRFERERAESRRRAEAWRRTHDALMFADEDAYEDDEDDEDAYDDDDDDISGDEDDEDDELGDPTNSANANDADADAPDRGMASRRARARLARMHRFFGAMHAHIRLAGRDARERGDLAALVLSDRDFTDADYERLLTLDNVSVKKTGLSADAMQRRGVVTQTWNEKRWASDDESSAPKCAVCLECFKEGDSVSKLPCTHQYHRACIERWLSSHVECPVCRVDLAGDERG